MIFRPFQTSPSAHLLLSATLAFSSLAAPTVASAADQYFVTIEFATPTGSIGYAGTVGEKFEDQESRGRDYAKLECDGSKATLSTVRLQDGPSITLLKSFGAMSIVLRDVKIDSKDTEISALGGQCKNLKPASQSVFSYSGSFPLKVTTAPVTTQLDVLGYSVTYTVIAAR